MFPFPAEESEWIQPQPRTRGISHGILCRGPALTKTTTSSPGPAVSPTAGSRPLAAKDLGELYLRGLRAVLRDRPPRPQLPAISSPSRPPPFFRWSPRAVAPASAKLCGPSKRMSKNRGGSCPIMPGAPEAQVLTAEELGLDPATWRKLVEMQQREITPNVRSPFHGPAQCTFFFIDETEAASCTSCLCYHWHTLTAYAELPRPRPSLSINQDYGIVPSKRNAAPFHVYYLI